MIVPKLVAIFTLFSSVKCQNVCSAPFWDCTGFGNDKVASLNGDVLEAVSLKHIFKVQPNIMGELCV